jgi:hypothetical protein
MIPLRILPYLLFTLFISIPIFLLALEHRRRHFHNYTDIERQRLEMAVDDDTDIQFEIRVVRKSSHSEKPRGVLCSPDRERKSCHGGSPKSVRWADEVEGTVKVGDLWGRYTDVYGLDNGSNENLLKGEPGKLKRGVV